MSATLTPATAARTGVDIAGVACTSGGDSFQNDGSQFLLIKNGDISSHDVIVTPTAKLDGQSVAARTVAVAAGVTKIFGPFPPAQFNDADDLVQVTYSAVTSMTAKVIKCVPNT